MSVDPPFNVVLVTSNVTAAVDITVMIWPTIPSSKVVSVCSEACVFQRLPVSTEGVVSEAGKVPNVPLVFAPNPL
tara:strand:- start:894 stop:1118 length:225 start_codon:yes stop_codon:yes gene_type:complete